MAQQRIQKVLSDQGVCSRRAAEKLIDEGRVKVNGHPVTLGDKMDPDFDKVSIDGKNVRVVRKRQYIYLMLNKPRGYLTTASDERGRKTVMDLLTGLDRRVYPVGRLDKDSEGLLLLTDDGAFANLLTHPSGGVGKLYRVTVRPRATEEQVVQMASGVVLDDGVKTRPAVIHVVTDEPGRTVMEITLHEGRNRQIRRMCEAVGLEVIRLKRTAEGPGQKEGPCPTGKARGGGKGPGGVPQQPGGVFVPSLLSCDGRRRLAASRCAHYQAPRALDGHPRGCLRHGNHLRKGRCRVEHGPGSGAGPYEN